MFTLPKDLATQITALKILIVDDQHYMRKVIRTMLAGIGIKDVHEAADGAEGLSALAEFTADIALVDWDMPLVNGLEFVKMVRSDTSPCSTIPIIMLTGHGDRWRVVEASRWGVHEFLLKPISTQALLARLIALIQKPRAMIKLQNNLVPAPRKLVVLDADTLHSPNREQASTCSTPTVGSSLPLILRPTELHSKNRQDYAVILKGGAAERHIGRIYSGAGYRGDKWIFAINGGRSEVADDLNDAKHKLRQIIVQQQLQPRAAS